ncbi:MAG: cation-transporting P-type ATPase [Patescibacteria group bacterium]
MDEIFALHIKTGLDDKSIEASKIMYGRNVLSKQKEESDLTRFLKQFTSPLVFVLLIVAGVSVFLKEYSDAIVVAGVVVVNAIIGFVEEGRAKKIISSLQKLTATKCVVKRNGEDISILTEEVVVGDIVELYDGDVIPADGVIVKATHLQIAEAPITGESYPVEKHALRQEAESSTLNSILQKVSTEKPDGMHLVYRSCTVSSGKGTMLVTSVGDKTTIGQIQEDVGRVAQKPTIIEAKLKKLTYAILWLTGVVCLLTIIFGLVRNIDFIHILEISVSLGVSVIPEGLPIVVTITLAIGAFRVGRGKALLRNLPSAASLAGISVICTDKTGTLTEGKLAIKNIVPIENSRVELKDDTHDAMVLRYAAMASEVRTLDDGRVIGDALDVVIRQENEKLKKEKNENFKLIDEIPFDSRYKFSAKLYKENNKNIAYIKGAPEVLLEKSSKKDNTNLSEYIQMTAKGGIRTLGIGRQEVKNAESFNHELIGEIQMIGFIEFEDPVRKNVREAILRCEKLGITPIMITGDHIETARYVALETGIIRSKEEGVYEAEALIKMSEEELEKNVENIRVISRATPQDKMNIVEMLHKYGKKVAMSGDGVNDAPALAASEIGIAMGKSGTEVAKEAADMILTDDDFTHIVAAVVEARVVIENIRKVLVFLLSTSIAEVIMILGALVLGLPVPLLAAQILWLNLVTDGFLNAAMATENKEDIIERRLAKAYHDDLLFPFHYLRSFILGLTMGIGTLVTFWFVLQNNSLDIARTVMLILMVLFQWLNVFNVRTYRSVFRSAPHGNKAIIWALLSQGLLQLIGIYTVYGNNILETVPVAFAFWIFALFISVSVLVVDEIYKLIVHEMKVI